MVLVFLSGLTEYRAELEKELEKQIHAEVEPLALSMYRLCEAMHKASLMQRKHALTIMRQLMDKQGPARLGPADIPVKFTFPSGQSGTTKIPLLHLGNTPVPLNASPDKMTPVVDEMMTLTGYHSSIMLRMNEQGDFIRVATSVVKDNKRQIGVVLPALEEDGTPNSFSRDIVAGKTAVGRTYVEDYVFVSTALPLKDSAGNIIGLYGPGIRQDLMENLRKVFMDTPVGKSGYFFIIGTKGRQKGRYILSRKGKRDGEYIWNVKTQTGEFPVRQAYDLTRSLPAGKVGWLTYDWQNPNDNTHRKKYAALMAFHPWDWIVGASAYEEDFAETSRHLGSLLTQIIYRVIGSVIIVLAFSALACWLLGKQISKPLTQAVSFAKAISRGNFPAPLAITSTDETGQLVDALNTMSGRLEQTLRKQRQAEHDFRTLYEASRDALLIIRNDTFTDCNQAALDLFGARHKDDIIGKHPFILSPKQQPSGADSEQLAIQRITQARELGSSRFEWVHTRLDGTPVSTEVQLSAMDIGGHQIVHTAIRDISRRKEMEEMVVQSEKMMSVGGLAAGMAHEINNPLAGMIQSAQVIQNRLSRDLAKNTEVADSLNMPLSAIREYAEQRGILRQLSSIRNAGDRAARIVDNMLSFSRREAVREPKDICDLLDRTIELARNDYDLKKRFDFLNINIVRDYQPGLPPVPCESNQIQQVFFNILKNGAEAMAENNIEEAPPCFTLSVRQTDDMIRVSITDNGPGMDEALRKRVFEPFFTTKPVGVGTGLGLSVSFFIITKNHGGEITVSQATKQETGQTHGTRFTITLPMETPAEETYRSN